MKSAQRRATVDLLILALSVFSGITIVVCALFMRAGRISAAAIVTAPAGALIFCYRDKRFAPRLGLIVTAINLILDAALAFSINGLRAAWDTIPAVVAVWAALLFIWQLLPAIAAVRRTAVH